MFKKKTAKPPRRPDSSRRRGLSDITIQSAKNLASRDRWILLIVVLGAFVAVSLAAIFGGGFLGGDTKPGSGTGSKSVKSSPAPRRDAVSTVSTNTSPQAPGQKSTAAPPPAQPQPGELQTEPQIKSAVDVMDSLVIAVKKAGLDTSQIRVLPEKQGDNGMVVLVMALPGETGPQAIKDAVQKQLVDSGLTVKWGRDGDGIAVALGTGGKPSHRMVFMPSTGIDGGAGPKTQSAATAQDSASRLPRLAIVIDDLGQNIEPAKQLLALDMKLTYSILPNTANAAKVAALVQNAGRSIMLHLPMQPKDIANAKLGKDALMLNMSGDELQHLTEKHLSMLPGASGVNNHMGSAFTENAKAMQAVLSIIKQHNLFFLDSVTSPNTKAIWVARKLGIPSATRDVFLDYDKNGKVVAQQLKKVLLIAKQRGSAIAIGHPYPATIEALKRAKPMLSATVEMVDAQSLMSGSP